MSQAMEKIHKHTGRNIHTATPKFTMKDQKKKKKKGSENCDSEVAVQLVQTRRPRTRRQALEEERN